MTTISDQNGTLNNKSKLNYDDRYFKYLKKMPIILFGIPSVLCLATMLMIHAFSSSLDTSMQLISSCNTLMWCLSILSYPLIIVLYYLDLKNLKSINVSFDTNLQIITVVATLFLNIIAINLYMYFRKSKGVPGDRGFCVFWKSFFVGVLIFYVSFSCLLSAIRSI